MLLARIIKYFLLAVIISAIVVQAYMYWPIDIPTQPIKPKPEADTLVVMFHGAGGPEKEWQNLVLRVSQAAEKNPAIQVENILWLPWSKDFFRAAVSGETIAKNIGEQIAVAKQIKTVHLIATSAGSYGLRSFCEVIRERRGEQVFVKMTYLDPVGVKGLVDFFYGQRNYGQCADDAEVFFNRDDYVPGSNAPLPHARSVDVTFVSEKKDFVGDGHSWPVRYYAEYIVANALN